ncbi:MAG: hypothetical protein K0Q90_4071 [Paenibacillaceae bacterium]|jgi:lysophospholipase L1-like esterase|nr:hypothetical protein [Paenibacillaceae bacterium]
MKTYSCNEAPLQLYGLNHIQPGEGDYWRLPPELIGLMPQYDLLGKRCSGARVRFRTDASEVVIRFSLKTEKVDRAMGLPAAAGVDAYTGTGVESRYAGYVAPSEYGYKDAVIEGMIKKKSVMETVTLNLPRNEQLSFLEIAVEDHAVVEEAEPYAITSPIVFYGSSITEGGCAPRPGTAYTSIVSRWLDADYFNYGFSGSAKGEPVFAEFIAAHPAISAFVYDYDHNAPTPEHLEETHRAFFEIIRKAHPSLPVLMLSRPDFDWNPKESDRRRGIIMDTYLKALRSGDSNVYFIDGQSFFGPYGREECTIDGCHPTSLGFMRMAERIYPLLRQITAK